jgi:hypothetical protein
LIIAVAIGVVESELRERFGERVETAIIAIAARVSDL